MSDAIIQNLYGRNLINMFNCRCEDQRLVRNGSGGWACDIYAWLYARSRIGVGNVFRCDTTTILSTDRDDISAICQLQSCGDIPILIAKGMYHIIEQQVDILCAGNITYTCAELKCWIRTWPCYLTKLNHWRIARHVINCNGLTCAVASVFTL